MSSFTANSNKEINFQANKHDALDTDAHFQSRAQTSKPSSGNESILVNEPIENLATNEDTEKVLANDNFPETISDANENTHKESALKGESNKEAIDDEKKESGDAETKQDEGEYPSWWRLLLITIALCLCVFCVALVWYLPV